MTSEHRRCERYTRRNIPPELANPDEWPQLDDTAQPPDRREWITKRRSAIRAYLRGDRLRVITREFGIADAELLRLLNRCLQPHPDGRNYGFRALVPDVRIKVYTRIRKPEGAKGLAGAFEQFLLHREELNDKLKDAVFGQFKDALPESRASHRAVYSKFRRLCNVYGVTDLEYPLCCKDQGRRALRRYVLKVLQTSFARGAARTGGPDAAVRSEVGVGARLYEQACGPFDEVSIDAHALNFVGTIIIPTPTGCSTLPIHRLHLLPLIEHSTRLVLGYSIAIGRQPSAQDVTAAVQRALGEWTPRELKLAGFRYPPGAIMPSALPGVHGLCWSCIYIDNASIHYSNVVAERIRRVTGAAVNWGSVGKWYRRAIIESLFSTLERHGFTRLPNSTGFGPADPQRADAVATAIKHEMDIEELLDLIEVCICVYNATAQASIDNLSPLQRLRVALDTAWNRWLPRRLPARPAEVPGLDVEVVTATVRGNQKKGRRPFVQLAHVHYTSPVLANSPGLIGTQLRIHFRRQDLRTVRAFTAAGAELGILVASSDWGRTPHDLTMRKQILRAMRDRSLVVPPGTDPIQEFLVLKATQAVERSRKDRSRSRVSDAATVLARSVQVSGEPVPVAATPVLTAATAQKLPDYDGVRAPSFLPQVLHKGRLK